MIIKKHYLTIKTKPVARRIRASGRIDCQKGFSHPNIIQLNCYVSTSYYTAVSN